MNDNDDMPVEVAALVFEARLSLEAVVLGLTRVIQQERSPQRAVELETLRRMGSQAAEALEALQKVIVGEGGG